MAEPMGLYGNMNFRFVLRPMRYERTGGDGSRAVPPRRVRVRAPRGYGTPTMVERAPARSGRFPFRIGVLFRDRRSADFR